VWGTFTLRESLDSLREQFRSKCDKAQPWKDQFGERWLLLHLDSGSPFSELVATRDEPVAGKEEEVGEHRAKVVFEVCSILAESGPFDYVMMYSGCQIVAFPCNGQNPHKLPMPRWDLVAKGARVHDSHLSWKSTIRHVKKTESFEAVFGQTA
jgi:hypothetical protein